LFRAGAGREDPDAIRKRIVMTTFRTYRDPRADSGTTGTTACKATPTKSVI
jgi:hypothetical protein